jgi:two-component system response regulator FixJ
MNANPAPGPSEATRPLICIVEDDQALLASIRFSLGVQGMDAHCFSDATELLNGLPPMALIRCFVIDHILPDLPGLDLLERLRAMGHTAPAILITTNPKETAKARAAAMGVGILEKPILGDDLAVAIRLAISQ